MTARAWWKEAVVYQIYPRSFKDGNGDGVGDLRGITEKLDYIEQLGVDAIWLNPIYRSPNDDGGYDISDYYSIQPEFGTMAEFDELLNGLHERGLRLIMDLVLNHSSDEHPWFEESRKSRDNPYRDFYFWKPGKNGGPPNNWPSFFGGSAWQFDETTNEYYLHLFSRKQPDLNWETMALRDEIRKIMQFWLDKGVDGLRLDVISAISKRADFPDADTNDFNAVIRNCYANGPRLKEFLREMRHSVWDHYGCMTVGEGPGITPANAAGYLDPKDGLNMIFHFGHMFIDQGPGGRFDPVAWSMKDFKNVFSTWDETFSRSGWGSIFLGNHDFPRMVSRWGNDREYHDKSATLLATLLLSMRGTPFIFQGDEIGMTNREMKSVSESKDIETLTGWKEASGKGVTEEEFLRIANYSGRDNARTPVQWDATPTAGFSSAQPWMMLNPNSKSVNIKAQLSDNQSVLAYFRRMTALRKANHVLIYGEYSVVDSDNDKLFIYRRELDKEKWMVVLNFSSESANLPSMLQAISLTKMSGNYDDEKNTIIRPWEAMIFKVNE